MRQTDRQTAKCVCVCVCVRERERERDRERDGECVHGMCVCVVCE